MKKKTVDKSSIAQAWLLISAIILISLTSFMLMGDIRFFPSLDLSSDVAQFYYWITETASFPFAIITTFIIISFCAFRIPRPLMKKLIPALIISLLLSLGLGQLIKVTTKEIRPNIALMTQYHLLNMDTFNHLDKSDRQQAMAQAIPKLEAIDPNIQLSSQINKHWQSTTNYAFPSGHMLFAVTLTLIINYYLIQSGAVVLPILLMIWSVLISLSRLFLGLHWPQDILAATLLSIISVTIGLYATEKYLTHSNGSRRQKSPPN
ncbi:phosphatase PAP2 family protein [uncultured Shewanella sp.]|uniref:phosphatase PAP2 family protein n=1 Tax=uncultured Shewanella sp. TaxID=173975 RepID=UPI002627515C|nr:phosphatase PAP2 family protein [uncultured Shewanella sp.]